MRYSLTKILFRLAMLGAVLAFLGVFVFAVQLEKGNVAPSDMTGGFETSDYSPFGAAEDADASAKGQLSIQNLSTRDVSRLLSVAVTEALSFDRTNFTANVRAMQKYFTPEGYTQYTAFLESTGLQQALTAQNLRSGALVDHEPLERSHGVYGDTFKWLFEVPVTLSFMPADADSYQGSAGATAQNRKFILRAQFTRVKDANDPDAVKIEIWQILPPRRT